MYYGDFLPGQVVTMAWSTNDKQGASISRAVAGAVICVRASTGTQTLVGVTDSRDLLGAVGIDACQIQTANPFYVPYDDYEVLLIGATVDNDQVNAVIGQFSIMNRSNTRLMLAGTVDASAFPPTPIEFECSDITTEALGNNLSGRAIYGSIGNVLIKQVAVIESSDVVGGKGHFIIPAGNPMTAPFATGSRIVIA